MAHFLSLGNPAKEAARRFKISQSRVTQLRQGWCRDWYALRTEEAPFEQRKKRTLEPVALTGCTMRKYLYVLVRSDGSTLPLHEVHKGRDLVSAGRLLPKQALPLDHNEGAGFWWANSRNTFPCNVACDCNRYGFRVKTSRRWHSGRATGPALLDARHSPHCLKVRSRHLTNCGQSVKICTHADVSWHEATGARSSL
jgi:hypothetical protein